MSTSTDRSPRVVRDPNMPEGAPGSLRIDRSEPKPRPLGASEVARAFLHRVQEGTDEHASIELSRNAKGDTQIKVAVRDPDPAKAAEICRQVYDGLRMVYPMSAPEVSDPKGGKA